MTDSGKTTSDNNKGSMTVLSEEAQSHIDWLKKFINDWIEEQGE